MKVYWWNGEPNFGDLLGPALLRHFGYRVEWVAPAEAELVTVGSILWRLPNGWRGTVLGSGFIQAGHSRDLSRARVLAVRGAFSRDAAHLPRRTPLGDLGVLAPLLPHKDAEPCAELVIPHFVDHEMAARHLGAKIGDPRGDPATLIGLAAGAGVIFTSSLHGLILADALGVPHVLEPHAGVHGGMFKFRDYASALGETITPGVERLSDRAAMAALQQRLVGLTAAL